MGSQRATHTDTGNEIVAIFGTHKTIEQLRQTIEQRIADEKELFSSSSDEVEEVFHEGKIEAFVEVLERLNELTNSAGQ